jgi:eukaryotic-like serine/threonine-protein kinase
MVRGADEATEHFGRLGWSLGEPIARSPQSVVYRADRDGVSYALKVMRAGLDREQMLHAFRREAAMLAAVGHPGLPRIYDVGEAGPWPYLAMELLAGGSLGRRLAIGPLEVPHALGVARQVAETLAAAHHAGLVHRDVKPDNIVFDGTGTPRLIDFGLAQASAEQEAPNVVGTLRYSAPEQGGMLKRPVDHRSDLYSFGVVLFECLTGTVPFPASDVGELLRAHAVVVPPAVSSLRPDVPPALDRIVATLLAKDPDDRYATADGLVADLTRLAAGETDFTLREHDDLGLLRGGDGLLVGRDGELAALTERWRACRAGAGEVALVRGRSGSGKSRLLRELARTARHGGGLVLAGACAPDGGLPYGPFRAAVEAYLAEPGAGAAGPAAHRAARPGGARLDWLYAAAGADAAVVGTLSPALAAVLGPGPADGTATESTVDGLSDAAPVVEIDQSTVEPEQFAGAVAAFLAALARQAGGLVLVLDDVQWLDDASRQVLRRLAGELPAAPLLVACGSRDDEQCAESLDALRAAVGTPAVDIAVPELSDDAVAALVTAQLGAPADVDFTGRLAGFVRGNPFAVIEYVRALVGGGFVSPCWGRTVVDLDGLSHVDIVGDVTELIGRQVEQLGAGREVLAVAAAVGDRFGLGVLLRAAAGAGDPAGSSSAGQVVAALTEGVNQRLIEPVGRDEYTFVHHRVREQLLAQLAPDELHALHQRIAAALDDGTDPRALPHPALYQLAHQYAHGELDRDPARTFEVCWAAGVAALADHAVAGAVGHLELAEQAAAAGRIALPAAFEATVGTAAYAAGDLDVAIDRLGKALAAEPDSFVRAGLLETMARVEYVRPNYVRALEHCRAGLTEIGFRIPESRLAQWARFALGMIRLVFSRFGHPDEATRRCEVMFLRFSEIFGRAAYQCLPRRVLASMTPDFLRAARRVGPGLDYVGAHIGASTLTGSILFLNRWRLPRLAELLMRRAERAAETLGDPRLAARAAVGRAHLQTFLGDATTSTATLRQVLSEQARWLPVDTATEALMALTANLDIAGHVRESEQWRRRAVAQGLPFPTILFPSVVLGQPEEAEAQLNWVDRLLAHDDPSAIGPLLWGGIVQLALNVRLERNGLGPDFDKAVAGYERYGFPPREIRPYWERYWLMKAYGRLGQYRAAAARDRPSALIAATDAVAEHDEVAHRDPLLTAHHRVVCAELSVHRGHLDLAERLLADADRLAERLDAPWVRYEAACTRARLLHARGLDPAASAAAAGALMIAEAGGWVYRAARVRREFAVDSGSASRSGAAMSSTSAVSELRDSRYLEALLQVSTAAASVLDPRELARVALDELLKILGAERAYLFACPAENAALERYAGRDADGNDLDELVGYSSTVVERARAERRALVVTGTEQGAAVGSESAVVHGLRSIMVAPLQLEGRLLGVVYLDSRVAKGIFARQDEEILVAIANQIAASLETARAAQLELEVTAERQRRGLADQLRDAGERLSRILDPTEVLDRAVELAVAMVGADSGMVLLTDGEQAEVAAVTGRALLAAARAEAAAGSAVPGQEPLGPGSRLPVPAMLAGPAATGPSAAGLGRQRLPEPLHVLLGRPREWLALPLSTRDSVLGILIVSTRDGAHDLGAHAGIGAVLAGQVAVAYDNARLFRQVEQLATTDGLTGLCNRRHFMIQATGKLSESRRRRSPLAAIMLDTDHFKQVNDTYGHATGDQVIRTVADRLTEGIRREDLLGRYGGEEFVLVIPDGEDGAVELAERLRRAVEADPIPTDDGPLRVTISVGVSMRDDTDVAPDTMLARADAALYQAKQGGRNQVAFADA